MQAFKFKYIFFLTFILNRLCVPQNSGSKFPIYNHLLIAYFIFEKLSILDFKDDGSHTTFAVPNTQLIKSALITGDLEKLNPVLYRGVSLVADSPNPLQLILMTASSMAYSYNPNAQVEEVW